MKSVHSFILLLLITYITCTCKKAAVTDPSVDNCKNNNEGDGYCCYLDAPNSSYKKACWSIEKYVYDHIKVYVDYMKVFGTGEEKKDDDLKIDCKSYYLQSSLIILILLFL